MIIWVTFSLYPNKNKGKSCLSVISFSLFYLNIWNVGEMTSSSGFQNVASTRVELIDKKSKRCRWNPHMSLAACFSTTHIFCKWFLLVVCDVCKFFHNFWKSKKKKVGSAPPRTALQKTYKKYFEKRCRKVSTSSLLAGVLVVGSGNFSLCNYRSTF